MKNTKIGIFLSMLLGLIFAGVWLQIGVAHSQNAKRNIYKQNLPKTITVSNIGSPIIDQAVKILIDDFSPQPYQGDLVYYYNRLGGDRGTLGNASLDWGKGQVTATVSTLYSWGGGWTSLNHLERESIPVDFSSILPSAISNSYQSQISHIKTTILDGTPGANFTLQLKDGPELNWSESTSLTGGEQIITFALPAITDTTALLWMLESTGEESYVILDELSFTATTTITDPLEAGFVWSYGMLLNNWDADTGLVRDRARYPRGAFEAVQATGSLAAATALAYQLGIVEYDDAVGIVTQISNTLLISTPRYHGLLPHFVEITPMGAITITENSEWSSVDTAIAGIGLLCAQSALGLDTLGSEELLQFVDWDDLVMPGGISHGYTYAGEKIPFAWDVFGGESWLVSLAYAAATHKIAEINYPTPPTANGSGFIDELAWLFVSPPLENDYWGVDWGTYREDIALDQIHYHSDHYPNSCPSQFGLFGLSAGEVPVTSEVSPGDIYQAFGIGGRFSPANDGVSLLGEPVIIPHYSAMITSLNSSEVEVVWSWLIDRGLLSPLNNVESLLFPDDSECMSEEIEWNHLKGSWNLALQTLGLGRYLVEQQGLAPNIWQATSGNTFLYRGYILLAPNEFVEVYLPIVHNQFMDGD